MKAKLRVIVADAPSRDVTLQDESVTIGRDPACDWSFGDEEAQGVSWLHARLESGKDELIVRDFNSTNGTILNGERLEDPCSLKEGDTVELGSNGPRIVVLAIDRSITPTSRVTNVPKEPQQPAGELLLQRIAIGAAAVAVLFLGLLAIRAATANRESASAPLESQPTPPEPSTIDISKWAEADLILADESHGAIALRALTTPSTPKVHILARVSPGQDMQTVLNAAWDSGVPIIMTVPALTRRVLTEVPANGYLPDYLHEQLASLFPVQHPEGFGELVQYRDVRGAYRIGYRTKATDKGFEFRPLNRGTTRFVSLDSLAADGVQPIAIDALRSRISTLEAALDRLMHSLWQPSDRPQFTALAVACDQTVAKTTSDDLELLLEGSPLQYEIRPDLIDFEIIGRKTWNRVDMATAKERRLLGITHLLLVKAEPHDELSTAPSAVEELTVRLVDLRTGNTMWLERGASKSGSAGGASVIAMADMPYMLHSGQLSMVTFRDKSHMPRELAAVARGPFADNAFCVAFVESATDKEYRLRPLHTDTSAVTVAADAIRDVSAIDPDALFGATDKYDPGFASWRLARHLLPPAGRITKISLPLVEIDLGRKFGAQVGQEFVVQRLPGDDDEDEVHLSYLPIRLRVLEVRPNVTVAEIVPGADATDEPKVGDVAVLVPASWLGKEENGKRDVRIRKPCVALLQIRTTSQGSRDDVEVLPLVGPLVKALNSTPPDQRSFVALRLASELEGVLIQHECDVADHSDLWLRMNSRENLSVDQLTFITEELQRKMHLTHVVLADLASAAQGGHDYVVFTVTELITTGDTVTGRQVAKVEIEFPRAR